MFNLKIKNQKRKMILYQSNRLENLIDTLVAIIDAEPLADPMVSEIVVVQNPGMGRWLCQQVARRLNICANFEVPLPASFFWNFFADTMGELPDLSLFERETLLWQIMAGLKELADVSAMAEIKSYLEDDKDGRNIFQLSEQVADLFDQYQVFRADMLLAWEQGDDNHWQAHLWRWLVNAQPSAMHRALLMEKFKNDFKTGKLALNNLPQRIFFFGINMLAPVYMDIIDRISRLTELHLFHLSPCSEYWEDITPERLLAIKRKTWRKQGIADVSNYFSSGNPLLASLGMVGREFTGLLMEYEVHMVDLYSQPEDDFLLAMIQGDILNLKNRNKKDSALSPEDKSIYFHCCHSPVREVQVLHDRLLDLFNQDEDLKPYDILVMAPDINRYAPVINGVFGTVSEEMRIPWSVSDLSRTGTSPVIDGFLAILALVSSRFTAGEVLALLENPAIMRNFGFDDEDMGELRTAIRRAGVRWGLNSRQRKGFVDDHSELNSWEAGIDRLLLSFMTGPAETPVSSISAVDFLLPGAGTGVLADFLADLKWLHERLTMLHPVSVWGDILAEIISRFFDASGDSPSLSDLDEILVLRKLIDELCTNSQAGGFTGRLSLVVIREYCRDRLEEPAAGQGLFTGRVSFSNMVPLRSLPFKVIYLLGMNDTAFPRNRRPPEFDLIAASPRLGDRSRRDDDRYLFLEALLSARSHFFISWTGRDQHDNTELPPSVVVAELMDYIDKGWQSIDGKNASRQLVVDYPLQPFSSRCFDGSSSFASYAELWLGPETKRKLPGFMDKPLPPLIITEINISRLLSFWNHPVRFFLEQHLGMRLYQKNELIPESEPFFQDNLQKYIFVSDIIKKILLEQDPQILHDRYLSGAELPREPFASLIYDEVYEEITEMTGDMAEFLQKPMEPEVVNMDIAGIHLHGELASLYQRGRFCFRPAKLKGQDILSLWIQHLVLLLNKPAGVQPVSVHMASDRIICFQDVAEPEKELAQLIDLFKTGCCEPLHFYPRTSFAWAEAKVDKRMTKAEKVWYSGYNHTGEGEDISYHTALRGMDNPLDSSFEELASLFLPILAHLTDHAAS